MGGLIGAIYVRPREKDFEESRALQYLETLERHTIVAHHFLTSSVNKHEDHNAVRTYPYLSWRTGSMLQINPSFEDESVQDIYFVNGQFQPIVRMIQAPYH